MRTVSKEELGRLQARGANVRALPVQPRPPGDATLQSLVDLIQQGAKRSDLEASAAELKQQQESAVAEARAAADAAERRAVEASEAAAAMRQELEAALAQAMAGVPAIARKEARKIVDNLPAPAAAEVVHHHPVIETREIVRPVHTVHTVERVIEEAPEPLLEMEVVRDRDHWITEVRTNKGVFRVERDAAGYIASVVRV